MNSQSLIRAALAGLIALGAVQGVASAAEPAGKEKCYGISKAGQNDCANGVGTHACSGQSKADNDPNEFKLVDAGACVKDGGSLTPAAK